MKIINNRDIKQYLSGFAGRDEALRSLLVLGLYGPLQCELDCLTPITDPSQLENERLKSKFKRASSPWFLFEPNKELDDEVRNVCSWLMDFITMAGDDYNGTIRKQAEIKMRNFLSFKELHDELAKGPLLSPTEYKKYYEQRIISREEDQGHIEHISELSHRHNLFQIKTKRGIISASENANNCLNSSIYPDKKWPHLKRIFFPDQWLYFSIRDADNKSVSTIGVDLEDGAITSEPNKDDHWRPIPYTDNQYDLVIEAKNIISDAYPQLQQNRPYETYPSV